MWCVFTRRRDRLDVLRAARWTETNATTQLVATLNRVCTRLDFAKGLCTQQGRTLCAIDHGSPSCLFRLIGIGKLMKAISLKIGWFCTFE